MWGGGIICLIPVQQGWANMFLTPMLEGSVHPAIYNCGLRKRLLYVGYAFAVHCIFLFYIYFPLLLYGYEI